MSHVKGCTCLKGQAHIRQRGLLFSHINSGEAGLGFLYRFTKGGHSGGEKRDILFDREQGDWAGWITAAEYCEVPVDNNSLD